MKKKFNIVNLPENKKRNGKEFYLSNSFTNKLDAEKELKNKRNINKLFGKRKIFIFESKNKDIVFKFGIYEQLITLYQIN